MSAPEEFAATDLTPYKEMLARVNEMQMKLHDASASIGAPCPVCHYVPQSWRNPQPRVPRSVTWRGQERPGTESADESPRESGETV